MKKSLLNSILRTALALATTYEDLSGTSAGTSTPSVGTYNFLTYNAFIVVDNTIAVTGGVAPHSPPKNIITGANFQSANGTPSITVAPPYTTFSLTSFWFGCDAELQEAAANVATQCTVTLAAFTRARGQEVAVASFTFTPPQKAVGQVPMIKAVLPSGFAHVYRVTVIESDPEVNGLGMDNLAYTVST